MLATALPGTPKLRKLYVYSTDIPHVDAFMYISHLNDFSTLQHSVVERIISCKDINGEQNPPPMPTVNVTSTLKSYRNALFKYLSRNCRKLSTQEFCECYVGGKRTQYENAGEKLRITGVLPWHCHVQNFVKFEKVLDKGDKTVPRNISPRTKQYNIRLGRYIKPIEFPIYKAIQLAFGSSSPVVSKGLNAVEVAKAMHDKWSSFLDPVAVGCDASRFDQHCSVDVLRFEHLVYQHCYRGSKPLKRTLAKQLKNIMYGRCPDGMLKTTVQGVRMSGDMNTALGNCIIMCGLVYSYFQQRCKFDLINNGDDCVLFMERADLHYCDGFAKHCYTLGFLMEMEEPVYEFESVEFCQTKPVYDGTQYRACRLYPQTISKDAMSTKPIDSLRTFNVMRNSIATCGLSVAGNLPVFGAFYRMLGRGAGDMVDTDPTMNGLKYLAKGLDSKYSVPTEESRLSFYRAFGTPPDLQVAIENDFDEYTLRYSQMILFNH